MSQWLSSQGTERHGRWQVQERHICTRLQKERFDEAEFKKLQGHFSLHADMLGKVKDNFRIMHPLPRVDEIDTNVSRL